MSLASENVCPKFKSPLKVKNVSCIELAFLGRLLAAKMIMPYKPGTARTSQAMPYNVIFRRVLATFVVVEKQYVLRIPSIC